MERKLLVVFALTFLVIMLFQPLLKKYGPQPPVKPASPPVAAQNQAQLPSQSPTPPPARTSTKPGTAGMKAAPAAPVQATSESETVIENDVYRIVFTNQGARVKSWVLKKYTDDKDGQLELVNRVASETHGYPLTLWTYDAGLRDKVNSALYVAEPTAPTLPQSARKDGAPADTTTTTSSSGDEKGRAGAPVAPRIIKFAYSDGDVSVEKSYTFDRESYVVGVKTAVYVKGTQVTAFPMWPAGFGDQTNGAQYATSQMAYQYGHTVERLSTSSWTILPSIKVIGGATIPGPFDWAGVSDQYFAAVFLPRDPENAAMVMLRGPIEIPHGGDSKQMDKVEVLGAAVGSTKGATEARIYVGPKALAELQSVAVPGITGAEPDLRAIIDFGWLGIIARPLFLWLKWMHGHIVANWGWAILLQTLVINVALLPLRLTQMKSMLNMQRV